VSSTVPPSTLATNAAVITAPVIVNLGLTTGSTVTFAINVSNVGPSPETLYAWQFFLHVNASLLRITQVLEGPALTDIANPLSGSTLFVGKFNATTGLVQSSDLLVLAQGYTDSGLVGGGVLAYVKATVLASGQTDLVFDGPNTKLQSIVGGTTIVSIGHTDVNGVFSNVPYNISPSASFTLPPKIIAGLPAHFDASASSDRDGAIVKYTWQFGDGNITSVSVPALDHTYNTPGGPFKVFLTVTDDGGATASANATFYVNGAHTPPVAIFTFSPSSPHPGDKVTFDGSASHAVSPDTLSSTPCIWSFGDGQTTGGCNTQHIYGQAGNYSVTLTVTDNVQLKNNTTQIVSVRGTATLSVSNAAPWWILPSGGLVAVVVAAAGIFLWRRRRVRTGGETEKDEWG